MTTVLSSWTPGYEAECGRCGRLNCLKLQADGTFLCELCREREAYVRKKVGRKVPDGQ